VLNGRAEVYLMSHRWDFSYFSYHAKARSRDVTMFRICTLRRESQPSKADQEEKRKGLMTKAWNPDFFKKKGTKESDH
jgi:hypothetical protein